MARNPPSLSLGAEVVVTLRVAVIPASPIPAWQQACLDRMAGIKGLECRDRADAADVIVLLSPQPQPPEASSAEVWEVCVGTQTARLPDPEGIVGELSAGMGMGMVWIVQRGVGGQADICRLAAGTRLQPWRPKASHRCLLNLIPKCLEAALMRRMAGLGPEDEPLPPRSTGRRPRMFPMTALWWLRDVVCRQWFLREQWSIGRIDAPLDHLRARGVGEGAQWLPTAKWSFLADPLIGEHDGRPWLFAESLNHWNPKGSIVGAQLPGRGLPAAMNQVLDMPFHVSYPFPILTEDGPALLPEAWESGDLRLHYLDGNRDARILIADLPAVDPTIFRHDGRWWLMATRQDGSPCEALHLWHADQIGGPWRPHKWNPVVRDPRRARPAGPVLVCGDMLIRPGQDCSETYGGAVSLMRIDALTPEVYTERRIGMIRPDPKGPFPHGLHTLSVSGDTIVIDGKRLVFSLLNPVAKLVAARRNHKRRAAARAQARTA